MADMFLVFDHIEGESLDDKYTKKIEIMSWNWTLGNNATWTMTQQEAAAKADVKAITVEKAYDRASVTLMKYCCLGQHIPTAQIICRKNQGEQNEGQQKLDYLVIKMQDVMIKNIIWSAGGFDKSPETVTLSFGKFYVEYQFQPTDEDYSGARTTPFGFDINTHKELTWLF